VVGLYARAGIYQEMGEQKKFVQDYLSCVELINSDEQANKMYQRYGHKMELLDDYFKNRENEIYQPTDPEDVMILPTITGAPLF
jgi:hypothetical protein